jgi:hypothetical protein
MTTGDFNKDGRPDLATANDWSISVTVVLPPELGDRQRILD